MMEWLILSRQGFELRPFNLFHAEFLKFKTLQEIYLILDSSSKRGILVPKTATLTCGSSALTIEENKVIDGRQELHHPVLHPENHRIF
jgi:hypothetical protein